MSTRNALKLLLSRPIAFHRSFVPLAGSVAGAVWLSQAAFWSTTQTVEERGGWFYKSREEWGEETGLSRFEQESVRKTLIKKGILEEKKHGIPCRIYFKININKIISLLETDQQAGGKKPNEIHSLLETDQQAGQFPANLSASFQQTNTENTNRDFSENTHTRARGNLKESENQPAGKGFIKPTPSICHEETEEDEDVAAQAVEMGVRLARPGDPRRGDDIQTMLHIFKNHDQHAILDAVAACPIPYPSSVAKALKKRTSIGSRLTPGKHVNISKRDKDAWEGLKDDGSF